MSLSSRSLAGSRAFTAGPSSSRKAVKVSNGAKWFMRRKDSFMVEVNVGEEEPEDMAVRRFMKSVVQSGVINSLRARRHKESKIEEYKRKLQERAQARRLKLIDPTWEELYGMAGEDEPRGPFDEFFRKGEEEDMAIFGDMPGDMPELTSLSGAFFASSPVAYTPAGDVDGALAAPVAGGPEADVFDLNQYEQRSGGYGYVADGGAAGGGAAGGGGGYYAPPAGGQQQQGGYY